MLNIISDAVAGFTGVSVDFAGDLDDRWYMPSLGGISSAGVVVTPETVLNCGVVLAALRWRADIFSQSQPSVIRRSGNRREEVEDHWAQRVLRTPCTWMTGVRWRHLQMVRAQLGNAYSEIVPGPTTFVEQLRPLDPMLIHFKAQRPDGTLVYEYRRRGGPPEDIGQERILHFRGFSMDGIEGLAMTNMLRNAVGIALLAEKHTATTLRKGARIAGLLIPAGDSGGKEKRQDLADSVNEVFGQHENSGQMGVLPWGVTYQPLAMDNQKAQLMELRDFQVGDILRFLGVPGVVVGWGEKTSTYASADAFFEEAKRCVLPWVVNFEAEEQMALLTEPGLSIKHNLDAVLRADTIKRYDALNRASGRPWMTGNEARSTEDKDPIDDDPSMDKVAPPPNQNGTEPAAASSGTQAPPRPAPRKKLAPPADEEQALAERFRQSAMRAWMDIAARVVRREISEVESAAPRPRYREADEWRAWVSRFYTRHGSFTAQALHVSPEAASDYVERRREELLAGEPVVVVAGWSAEYADTVLELAMLALGEDA